MKGRSKSKGQPHLKKKVRLSRLCGNRWLETTVIWCPLLIPFLIGFVRIAIDACTLGLAGAHLQHGVDAAGPAAANLLWQGGTDELEIRQAAADMGAANKGLVDPLLPAPNPSNAAFAWPRTIWRNSPPCQRQLHRRPT